jgi:hypothetical protein
MVVDTNVSFGIDDAVVELVDLGDVEGKGSELRLFAGEKLSRGSSKVTFRLGVGRVAELPCLLIDVGKIIETTAGEEVVLDVVHGALDPGGTIGVTFLVSAKLKAKALSEGFHLWYWDHLYTGSA